MKVPFLGINLTLHGSTRTLHPNGDLTLGQPSRLDRVLRSTYRVDGPVEHLTITDPSRRVLVTGPVGNATVTAGHLNANRVDHLNVAGDGMALVSDAGVVDLSGQARATVGTISAQATLKGTSHLEAGQVQALAVNDFAHARITQGNRAVVLDHGSLTAGTLDSVGVAPRASATVEEPIRAARSSGTLEARNGGGFLSADGGHTMAFGPFAGVSASDGATVRLLQGANYVESRGEGTKVISDGRILGERSMNGGLIIQGERVFPESFQPLVKRLAEKAGISLQDIRVNASDVGSPEREQLAVARHVLADALRDPDPSDIVRGAGLARAAAYPVLQWSPDPIAVASALKLSRAAERQLDSLANDNIPSLDGGIRPLLDPGESLSLADLLPRLQKRGGVFPGFQDDASLTPEARVLRVGRAALQDSRSDPDPVDTVRGAGAASVAARAVIESPTATEADRVAAVALLRDSDRDIDRLLRARIPSLQ